jgi:esterase/lipase
MGDNMLFRKAVLIIHGFGGGTYDEEYLAHRLELKRNFDVYTFTLAGHDGLFKSNMTEEDWIESTEKMINFLIQNNYKKIYVIGHSMGGVLAARLASKYKEIKKLVLLAAAFRYLEFKDNNVDIMKSLKKTKDIVKTYKDEIISRIIKMPPQSMVQFANTVKDNEKVLENVTIPTLIIQGTKDDLVPLETAKFISERINSQKKKVIIEENVTHDIFRCEEKDKITQEIIDFLK